MTVEEHREKLKNELREFADIMKNLYGLKDDSYETIKAIESIIKKMLKIYGELENLKGS